ncbi:hypothetical protein EH223_18690 [candidate division KSB1 bacterium]|nr:hypothetical protein [candidate division KSB1 bacterium]RQW00416.1 MAG: hypothetical protein EH223_18690 [candidate division KSB1 bacterium]
MKTSFLYLVLFCCAITTFAGTPASKFDSTFIEVSPYLFALNDQDDVLPAPLQKQQLAPKNRGKALFLSLLVPGLGQYYAEARTKGAVFLGMEIGLWLTYSGFKAYGNWRQNDYETFAASHAGVNLTGKDHTYFIDVGNFDNIYEHNEYRLRQRYFYKYYQDTEFWYWDWDSKANMEKFDQLRVSADTANNRAQFVLGMIVANHLISAIDAVWSVHKYETKRLSHIDWDIQVGDGLLQPTVNVSLSVDF